MRAALELGARLGARRVSPPACSPRPGVT
jgi:hypothetical protein